MRYWGLVLTLNSFLGPITLDSNTFEYNTIAYTDCGISYYINNAESYSNYYGFSSFSNAFYSQIRNLLYIYNTPYTI